MSDEFISAPIMQNIKRRFYEKNNSFNFAKLGDDKIEELNDLALNLRQRFPQTKLYKSSFYYKIMRFLSEYRPVLSSTENLYVLMKSCDPDMVVYDIYEDYSNMKEISSLIVNELGFFDPAFIKLERYYLTFIGEIDNYKFETKK